MDYSSIISKNDARIVITGDSLSYNRYSYDDTPRTNAFNCGVGLPSWSFRLRDYFITLDKQFTYGDEIDFSCKSVLGIDNDSEVPNTAMFDGRIKTLYPSDDVSFSVNVKSDKIVLYLQERLDSACTFDIEVDGTLALQNVCTEGKAEYFAGYALRPIVIPCSPEKDVHDIAFTNIKGTAPKITIAGIGAKDIRVNLTGKGSMTTTFFLENFEERIGKYHPDLLIITLGANDRIYDAPAVLSKHLSELFAKVFENSPECKILFLIPPASHHPDFPIKDFPGYTSLDTIEVYDRVTQETCDEEGKGQIETLSIHKLFEGLKVEDWRFDNIHLNKYGNNALFDAIINKLNLE